MSTAEELRQEIDDCRTRLLTFSATAKERARVGRLNEKKAEEADKELERITLLTATFRACINRLVEKYKQIERYAADRKELALGTLKTAIENAGLIVQDADINGIKLQYEDKKARIVDREGVDINLEEGSAFRTVLGMLIRYTLIKSQPNAIQAVFLDEMFNTLSDETMVSMRDYLQVFKNDLLIVGIEQRDILFAGIDKMTYKVTKSGDCSTIAKVADDSEAAPDNQSNEFDEL